METVTRFADRQAGSVSTARPQPRGGAHALRDATYLLSEDGRKASLLAGGDGHAVQQITLQVPPTACISSRSTSKAWRD